jgi:hypothetical protein
VGDELVARIAQLVGVAVAGEFEGVLERGAVDRRDGDGGVAARGAVGRGGSVSGAAVFARGRIELLDHGEEVGEELTAR